MNTIKKRSYEYWMKFAGFIGRVNSVIILSVFFIVVVGLYALPRKIFIVTRSLFVKRLTKNSFWIDKKLRHATLEELKRQF